MSTPEQWSAFPLEPVHTIQIDWPGLEPIRLVLLQHRQASEAILQCGSRAWCASWVSGLCSPESDIQCATESWLLDQFTRGRRTPRHEAMQLLRVLRAVKEAMKAYA